MSQFEWKKSGRFGQRQVLEGREIRIHTPLNDASLIVQSRITLNNRNRPIAMLTADGLIFDFIKPIHACLCNLLVIPLNDKKAILYTNNIRLSRWL